MPKTEDCFFLDTNIVMYAIGKEHPYKKPCMVTLKRVEEELIRVVINVEVLQEVLHRYLSLGKPRTATIAFAALKDLCEEVLPVLESDMDLALQLLQESPQITVRDAVHAATMRNNGLSKIISTDKHFDAVKGICRVDPANLIRPDNL